MWQAEILKRRQRTNRRGYNVVGDEQKSADDRDSSGPVTNASIDTATIRIMLADDYIVKAHQGQ
jgi:hypothetical protein